MLTGSPVVGLIFGKLVADVGFYGLHDISATSKFRNLLAGHAQIVEEVDDEIVAAVAAA